MNESVNCCGFWTIPMYTAKNATLQKTKQIKWKKNQNKKGVIFISISFGYAYEKNLRYYEHI